MSKKSVSFGIVLSCYKHCNFVKGCIESILKQNYSNIKILVFSDHKDCCFEKIEDGRINYFKDNKRMGQCSRINQGLDLLDTDYVMFFGVDDYLRDGVLTQAAEIIKKEKKEWYYGGHLNNNGLHKAKQFDFRRLTKENYIAGGSVFLRLDIARRFRFKEIFGLGGDWIMWYRVGRVFDPVLLDFPVYVERLGTSHIRKPVIRRIQKFFIRKYLKYDSKSA